MAATVAATLAAPTQGQEAADPPGLFREDGSYDMAVACPVNGGDLERDRLLVCIRALTVKAFSAEMQLEQLRERLRRQDVLFDAITEDLRLLYRWSHCHGAQTECAALRSQQ